MIAAESLADAGLGLDYGVLALERTTDGWVAAGAALRDDVELFLGDEVGAVEQIGSSSVVGLLAKPVIDLAISLRPGSGLAVVQSRLEDAGWIYRGDAGASAGHVFVLEARPWYRVAHIHVVDHYDAQWVNWVRLRGLLRRSPDARCRYETVKLALADELGNDRDAYTDGKTQIVQTLLDEPDHVTPPTAVLMDLGGVWIRAGNFDARERWARDRGVTLAELTRHFDDAVGGGWEAGRSEQEIHERLRQACGITADELPSCSTR